MFSTIHVIQMRCLSKYRKDSNLQLLQIIFVFWQTGFKTSPNAFFTDLQKNVYTEIAQRPFDKWSIWSKWFIFNYFMALFAFQIRHLHQNALIYVHCFVTSTFHSPSVQFISFSLSWPMQVLWRISCRKCSRIKSLIM